MSVGVELLWPLAHPAALVGGRLDGVVGLDARSRQRHELVPVIAPPQSRVDARYEPIHLDDLHKTKPQGL